MYRRASISLFKLLRTHSHQLKPASTSLSKPLSNHKLPHHKPTITPTPTQTLNPSSYTSQPTPELDSNKIIDEINLKFAEAREEIEAAMESKETVYFNEEAECARVAVKQVLGMFEGLLVKLDNKEREALQRSMGLKIEQLKAELQQLDD